MQTRALTDFVEFRHHHQRTTRGRWRLDFADFAADGSTIPHSWNTLHVAAKSLCGDAPHLYHPKYLQAIVAAAPRGTGNFAETLPIPAIEFSTDEAVRRSMTLNAMRMSTEYFQERSPRVLQLIENRLQLGQRDVAHDALVYLTTQLHDLHGAMHDARMLRADSIIAYLGLDETATHHFFLQRHLRARGLSWAIRNNRLGILRRQLELRPLLESQLRLLHFELQQLQHQEQLILNLIDAITACLYADSQ